MFISKINLVIALLTNVFVQGMSIAGQVNLVQGKNASLESSGTKILKNIFYKLDFYTCHGIHQLKCRCV